MIPIEEILRVTNKEFKLLLILRASSHSLHGLQIKRAGRYWFLPYLELFEMQTRGWVFALKGIPTAGDLAPTFYTITSEGERVLAREVSRRARA